MNPLATTFPIVSSRCPMAAPASAAPSKRNPRAATRPLSPALSVRRREGEELCGRALRPSKKQTPSRRSQTEADHSPTINYSGLISSDDTLDRYHEIIVPPAGMDAYHRNPSSKTPTSMATFIFTLGRALVTEVRSGKLFQRVEFATNVNPMAKMLTASTGKILNAVSVASPAQMGKWDENVAADARRL